MELLALVSGSALRAQDGRRRMSVIKNNFTSFTRRYTNRGKLWMARNKAYMRHPDANFGDEYSPNSHAVELFGKRTINSKFYINKDTPSIFYSERSSGPMHFKKNGQWITIDTRLSPKGPLLYEASNQEDPPGFDIKKKSSYIITSAGRTYFNHWKLYGENGSTRTLLATANWTYYTAGDDGIAIKNIFPGIDAEMKVSKGSIKTNFIVHSNKFFKYKTLLFRDSFVNGQTGNFAFSNGLPGNGLVSSADFRVKGLTVFHIKEGVMYQKENPSSSYQFIPYYLDHNNLTLAINSVILNAQVRTGDVIIDPLVQSMAVLNKDTINGSHSNQDCSLDTACKYDFMVPAPAQATIIDAMFSFEFTANAPCVGQDGAFSFTINGGCTSQKYAGTATGAGPQNFPNQSILLNNGAGVAGCFPAPVCGPQNIPFTFNFFRNCHGPAGCDGSCIGASKDLTITLVGRTLDSASLTASPQSSCAGAPVTLTARGYFGVAPYNFVWQGLPQFNGDSVIMVNPNTNTVYTVQVNDTCPGGGGPITKSINVNVLSKLPAPTFTSNSPVCTGGQLVLSAPSTPGTTYLMEKPGSGLGGQYTNSAVFNNVTAAYAGTWIAVATDTNGCTSDTARTTVVINPALSPTVTITSSATNICTGTLVSFTATASNAGNSPTYQWLLNGNKVGTNSAAYSSSSFVNNDAVSVVVSASGSCAGGSDTSNVIVLKVSPVITPTFNPIGPLCQNSTPPVLPPTSKEGIAGTWSPASINTSVIGTSVYVFTPSAGTCSTPVSLSITIVGSISPTFPTIANSYCQNTTAPPLPTTSIEGVTGTWSPASINTSVIGISTYKFTPTTVGTCSIPVSINITIVRSILPTFPTIAGSYCQNATAPALPPTSNEGIAGTWSPASINTSTLGTETYLFTPSSTGTCSSPVSLSITIVSSLTPTFPTIANSYCQNATAPSLPTTSNEGITGTWSPTSINTSVLGTTTFTFTPSSAGNCATSVSLNITIATSLSPTFPTIPDSFCLNASAPVLPTKSVEGIDGTWSPLSISTVDVGSTLYTFTPAAGQCGTSSQITIVVNPLPGLIMEPDTTIAPGTSTTLNPSVTGNIVAYQWNPSTGLNDPTIKNPVANPVVTTVYTLNITDDKGCEASGSMKVTVAAGTSKISVPNAFSPNGDGINDTWVIPNLSAYPGVTVDVYNRYGQLVFHSENNNKNWDGTYNGRPLPMATYYYIIDPKNNEKKIAGSVTIFK